jgi:hypothetical protein
MKTTTIPTIMITFGMEIRMKFQFRYVAGASNANYLDQVPGRRQQAPR